MDVSRQEYRGVCGGEWPADETQESRSYGYHELRIGHASGRNALAQHVNRLHLPGPLGTTVRNPGAATGAEL